MRDIRQDLLVCLKARDEKKPRFSLEAWTRLRFTYYYHLGALREKWRKFQNRTYCKRCKNRAERGEILCDDCSLREMLQHDHIKSIS